MTGVQTCALPISHRALHLRDQCSQLFNRVVDRIGDGAGDVFGHRGLLGQVTDLGGQGGALDIGFSFDPLAGNAATRIEPSARPFLELLAFVGLQRFRPRAIEKENRFLYCAWNRPLPIAIAAPAANGMLPIPDAPLYEFRLLYRTKYLKSFLPAIPFTGGSDE